MLDLALMLEGQNGLNWQHWQTLARAAEDLGFAGLYRSDHYTNANPPDLDSLELWVSLTWLASHTSRIEFGPLVSPVSFRQPTMTARMASAVDDLSGGRLTLGLGAGWQAREHEHYGWDLLDAPRRFARFEEGLKIISHLLRRDAPLDFAGEFYRLKEAVLLPRPRRSGLPILIGGNGPRRTLPLVARYAGEWNAVYVNARKFDQLNAQLDELLAQANRPLNSVRRSLMTGLVFGRDEAEVQRKLHGRAAADLRARGLLVGAASAIVDQLGELAEVGVQRVMAQWLDLADVDGVEALAKGVLPQLH
jgi:F420-dependent oxidoreductase-like protein